MNNKFYILRHAETKKDTDVHAINWHLSDEGKKNAEEMANSGALDEIEIIFSSEEDKAYETVLPTAKRNNLEITRKSEFNELKRGNKFLPKEEFEKLKREKLEDLDCEKDGGETGCQALKRFILGINKIDSQYKNKKILISTHGTILAIYFAHIGGFQKNIFQRWKDMKFCAWGEIEDSVIKKDIN